MERAFSLFSVFWRRVDTPAERLRVQQNSEAKASGRGVADSRALHHDVDPALPLGNKSLRGLTAEPGVKVRQCGGTHE